MAITQGLRGIHFAGGLLSLLYGLLDGVEHFETQFSSYCLRLVLALSPSLPIAGSRPFGGREVDEGGPRTGIQLLIQSPYA